ncbi:peroxisomal biogenesis factor 11 [Cladochytrium replicatum]|nr:peroxisomal biogenesis factor 11 [Cladochytrium replicatum]
MSAPNKPTAELLAFISKLAKFLDSVRGTDKALMLIQYISKVLAWRLNVRAAAVEDGLSSPLASRLLNLAGPIGDFRILLRYYGLLPLIRWIILSELNPASSPKLQTLTRLQNLCNLFYYPLEHLYWLSAHKVLHFSDAVTSNLSKWSCRFWGGYVVLYYVQLFEEYQLLSDREKQLASSSSTDSKTDKEERIAIKNEKYSLLVNSVINTAYFPMTIHFSLQNSPIPDSLISVCGLAASVLQITTAWQAMK